MPPGQRSVVAAPLRPPMRIVDWDYRLATAGLLPAHEPTAMPRSPARPREISTAWSLHLLFASSPMIAVLRERIEHLGRLCSWPEYRCSTVGRFSSIPARKRF